MKNKVKVYAIFLDDNDFMERNLEDEILLFDNYEQIGEYAVTNDINFERITVVSLEAYEELDDIPEVEF